MKKLKLLLLSCILGPLTLGNLYSQDFGEKWMVNGQRYFKIKTAANGVYRISYQDLVGVGFPVGTAGFNKRKIQLFHRGVEQAIYIPGPTDGALNTEEFVEFYGIKNDGTLDVSLYKSPGQQPHGYYNLYSDTTAYFLTYAFGSVLGKRMEVKSAEFNSGGLPKETYHLDEKLQVYSSEFSEGQYYPPGSNAITLLSEFDTGEGWTGGRISKPNSASFTIGEVSNIYSGGPKPVLEVLIVGRNNRRHNANLTAGPTASSQRAIKSAEFDYYNKGLINENIEFSDISGGGKLELKVQAVGYADNNTDVVSVSYFKLTYPQTFNFGNASSKVFNLVANSGGKSFVEITNFTPGSVIYDITDKNNVKRLNYFTSGSTVSTVVSGTQSGRKLLVINNDYKNVKPQLVSFRNLSATAKHIIITHSSLRKHEGGVDPIKAYAEYRASAAGGAYDTLTVDIEQLYNQFTYGEVTPLAIRRFADYMLTYGNPQFLFLIGKSIKISYPQIRTVGYITRSNGELARDLVPSGGFPGSDIILVSGLKGAGYEPAIPIGRIVARNGLEVLNYLNKVKEMEAVSYDDLWHKKLIHLSGGLQQNEVGLFKSYVKDFETVAKDKYLGGSVTTISKTTNLNVEYINISEQVNEGTKLITFFGHSGADITDIEIGKCSDPVNGYNNKGKYPMIFVNGCDAGDVFTPDVSVGEDWTLSSGDKGAVAFLAFSHLAYAGPLKRFADEFYSTLFGDSIYINKPIGEVFKETAKRFLEKYSPTELYQSQVNQMILQADPAHRLFKADKPDYQTNDQQLYLHSYDGKTITASTDSFAVAVVVKNLGRVSLDTAAIKVRRTLTSGKMLEYDTILTPVFNQDTIFVNIKSREEAGYGENIFEVILDSNDSIPEMNENNNIGTIRPIIPMSRVVALQPAEFSIVNTPEVTLIAQSTDILKRSVEFTFEADTSYQFNSPLKKQIVTSTSTIPTWKIQVDQVGDTTVYFWRVKVTNDTAKNNWSGSSFTFIKNGPEGWAQTKYPQLRNNEGENLTKNDGLRKLEFTKVESKFSVKTHGNNFKTESYKVTRLQLNGFTHIYDGLCGNNVLLAVAFNKVTAEPYLVNNKIQFGASFYCGRRFNEIVNRFTNTQVQSTAALEAYIDKVPEGDRVLLFSSGLLTYESWPATTKNKLKEIGVDIAKFNQLKNGYGYIIFGQKGAVEGSAYQYFGNASDPLAEEIQYENSVSGQYDRGTLTSAKIGPSVGWGTLYKKSDLSQDDVVSYDIIGIDNTDNEYIVASKVQKDTFDLSFVNDKQFSYLKIRANLKDSINLTPPQVRRWQVNYKGVPEGVVYLVPGQKADSLEFEEGAEFEMKYVFRNITDKDFSDSLTVQQSFTNATTRQRTTVSKKYRPLPKYDSLLFDIKINTLDRTGLNSLQAYVNPKIQLEQNYFNNILLLNNFLKVNGDGTNPILDVVFDGVHIMDGDIVSPSPLINISLKDENKYKLKKDTAGIEVFLKSSCESCQFKRISFTDPQLKWQPANETSGFRIEYQPQDLDNGKYVLLVQGEDESGNKSGIQPYQVSFEVINESTVTNFYPYPNPFSTKTRFVFTVTGRDVPDDISILVMTISGKVVREISRDELGAIKIGNNISEFYWDGTDQFGDKLANGVYLYKVSVKKNGIAVDHRQTAGDKGFHKGFGKMYILR